MSLYLMLMWRYIFHRISHLSMVKYFIVVHRITFLILGFVFLSLLPFFLLHFRELDPFVVFDLFYRFASLSLCLKITVPGDQQVV